MAEFLCPTIKLYERNIPSGMNWKGFEKIFEFFTLFLNCYFTIFRREMVVCVKGVLIGVLWIELNGFKGQRIVVLHWNCWFFWPKFSFLINVSVDRCFFLLLGPGGLGRSTVGHRTVHVSTGHEDVDRNQSVARAAKADVQKRRADQTGRPIHENSSSIVPQ